MKVEKGYRTLEEAKDRAERLLAKGNKKRKKTFFVRTETDDLYHSIEFMEEGSIAFVFPVEKSFSMYILTTEEADPKNFTFPFRNLLKEDLFYILRRGAAYRKPTKALTTEEAMTPTGAETLYSFLPNVSLCKFCTDRGRVRECTAIEVFSSDESDADGTYPYPTMELVPLPSLLEEVTGLRARSEEEYVSVLTRLLRGNHHRKEKCKAIKAVTTDDDKLEPYDLSEEEKAAVRSYYFEGRKALFRRYLLYEFARTESYKNLQENLEKYLDFNLTEEEVFCSPNSKKTTEDYVLLYYVGSSSRSEIGTFESLREIAKKIGVTYERLLRVERGRADYTI